VLDLRAEAAADADLLAQHGLRYRRVPVPDYAAPDPDTLKEAVDWVMEELANDRKVLVHCRVGAGRSPFVACAVLLRMGYDVQSAYETVRRQRPEMVLTEDQAAALQEHGQSEATA
jgi:protein-tyrosine phosphatase